MNSSICMRDACYRAKKQTAKTLICHIVMMQYIFCVRGRCNALGILTRTEQIQLHRYALTCTPCRVLFFLFSIRCSCRVASLHYHHVALVHGETSHLVGLAGAVASIVPMYIGITAGIYCPHTPYATGEHVSKANAFYILE